MGCAFAVRAVSWQSSMLRFSGMRLVLKALLLSAAVAMLAGACLAPAHATGTGVEKDPPVDPAPCLAAIAAGGDDRIVADCGALIDNDRTTRAAARSRAPTRPIAPLPITTPCCGSIRRSPTSSTLVASSIGRRATGPRRSPISPLASSSIRITRPRRTTTGVSRWSWSGWGR